MARFLSLSEAVEDTIRDGDTVAMEGFTHLIPHAAGHEIIRQKRKDLTLIRMTPDLIYDQLIGMGCADKLVFSWGGNPGVGSLHRLRDAVENGWPQPARDRGAFATPPWRTPTRRAPPACRARSSAAISASTCRRSIRTSSTSPARSPARSSPPCRRIRPDVAVIHAQRADRAGNVLLEGIVGVQKEAVLAAEALDRHGRGDRRRFRRRAASTR